MARRGPEQRGAHRRAQRGLSIVELMVGIAVGLMVVAGAAMLTSTQMSANRRLMLDAQVQQDVRASTDILVREVRRAGAMFNPHTFVATEDQDAMPSVPAITTATPVTGSGEYVEFRYQRTGVAGGALRFVKGGTVLKIRRSTPSVGLYDLTDARAVSVNAFSVVPLHESAPIAAAAMQQRIPCPKLCADGTTDCWPQVRVRLFDVNLEAKATTDAAVRHDISAMVRPRTDQIITSGVNVCPV